MIHIHAYLSHTYKPDLQCIQLRERNIIELSKKKGCIQHYRRSQMILLVGEGDFSFSACLARAFGTAHNMVATSLDSKETLSTKHWSCVGHLEDLEKRGCLVLHEVDVHDMNKHPTLVDLKFDIIIFNFPHAGHAYGLCEKDIILIERHQNLLRGFFGSACQMLNEGGEIHVTHRDDHPYNEWEVEKQAQKAGLICKEKKAFIKDCYPGYHNKRGSFINGNKKFPIENSFTFKFIVAYDDNQETKLLAAFSTPSNLHMPAGGHQEPTLISSNKTESGNQIPLLSDDGQMSTVGDPHETKLISFNTESDHQMFVLSKHDQILSVGDPHETTLIGSKTESDHDQISALSDHDQIPSVGDPDETTLINSKITQSSCHDQINALCDQDQVPSVGDHQERKLITASAKSNQPKPSVGDNQETMQINPTAKSDHQIFILFDHLMTNKK